jgi:hypothetical protein
MFSITFVPKVENRTCNENRRESSGYDSDNENKGEIVDDSCSENPK